MASRYIETDIKDLFILEHKTGGYRVQCICAASMSNRPAYHTYERCTTYSVRWKNKIHYRCLTLDMAEGFVRDMFQKTPFIANLDIHYMDDNI